MCSTCSRSFCPRIPAVQSVFFVRANPHATEPSLAVCLSVCSVSLSPFFLLVVPQVVLGVLLLLTAILYGFAQVGEDKNAGRLVSFWSPSSPRVLPLLP